MVIAGKLAKLIDLKTNKVTEREKKDYWILKNPKRSDAKLTKQEKLLYQAKKLSDNDLYRLKLNRITSSDLKHLSANDLEVLAIYHELALADKFSPQIVKNNGVTPREYAVVNIFILFQVSTRRLTGNALISLAKP